MLHRLQADVVIGLQRVPVQRPRDRVARHAGADRVGEVGRLLGVDGDEVVDGRVGGHDDGPGGDHGTGLGLHPRRAPAVDPRRMGAGMDLAAELPDPPRSAATYLSGWNCAWHGKRRHRPVSNADSGARATISTSVRPARWAASRSRVQDRATARRPGTGSRQPGGSRNRCTPPRDGLDPVDGDGVALGGQAGPFLAVDPRPRRTGRRWHSTGGRWCAGLAAGDGAVVQHHDAPALAGEQVGRGQPRDAGPDHADIRLHVFARDRCRGTEAVSIQADFVASRTGFAMTRPPEPGIARVRVAASPDVRAGRRTPGFAREIRWKIPD